MAAQTAIVVRTGISPDRQPDMGGNGIWSINTPSAEMFNSPRLSPAPGSPGNARFIWNRALFSNSQENRGTS